MPHAFDGKDKRQPPAYFGILFWNHEGNSLQSQLAALRKDTQLKSLSQGARVSSFSTKRIFVIYGAAFRVPAA